MKVVLIDDSQSNMELMRALCSSSFDECVSFTYPQHALEYLQNNDASAIIVDYSMPKLTGIEMVKKLRASGRHDQTPIIMVTSSTELAIRRRALEVGVTHFLNKPVKPVDFKRLLAEVLAFRHASSTPVQLSNSATLR